MNLEGLPGFMLIVGESDIGFSLECSEGSYQSTYSLEPN